jgi:pimeloyl-ACP methyl ester carboxylesterase
MSAAAAKRPRAAMADDAPVPAALAAFEVPGLVLTDHSLTVPLDWSGARPGAVEVFFRVAVARARRDDASLPFLLYLQGGPGFEAPRPTDASGWLKAATAHFRVVLLDQRGTGRSTRLSASAITALGAPEEQAAHLALFRADAIVRDAEAVRAALVPAGNRDGRWSVLGQSFGGFCATTYLSLAPGGLAEVLLTGGLPPRVAAPCSAEEVYRRTWRRVAAQNRKFYARFPGAAPRAARVVRALAAAPGGGAETPGGNRLTPRAFQLLGLSALGFAHGFERLHFLLEAAFDSDEPSAPLSHAFLKAFDSWISFDSNPLYALLHEAIYCQGAASAWAAHRVRAEPELAALFDAAAAAAEGRPVFFTGEMVFPWMFEDLRELRPLAGAAERLAATTAWPALYDAGALARCEVPVAAAVYYEDIFVDFDLSLETLAGIGSARSLVTSEHMHDGIREGGAALFEKLLSISRGGTLVR